MIETINESNVLDFIPAQHVGSKELNSLIELEGLINQAVKDLGIFPLYHCPECNYPLTDSEIERRIGELRSNSVRLISPNFVLESYNKYCNNCVKEIDIHIIKLYYLIEQLGLSIGNGNNEVGEKVKKLHTEQTAIKSRQSKDSNRIRKLEKPEEVQDK